MEAKEIYAIIDQTYKKSAYKKIFINGAWGIGKSYYADKFYRDNSEKNILYISLFGKSTVDEINDEIDKQVLKKIKGIQKLFKKGGRFLNKFKPSIDISLVSIDIPNIGKKFLLEGYAEAHKKETIMIIIDDIERKSEKVSIIDIMGIIESMSLISNIKIVLIGDETNIQGKELKNWKNFKEKIIEKEYKIDSFSIEAINSLIVKKISKYLNENDLVSFIDDFFQKHKIKNLRSINKSVNLFEEVLENYVKNKKDKENNLIIFKNCLAVTIEYTEELYKPRNEENNADNQSKLIISELDKDIVTRILSHYFNALFMNTKDSNILNYIIDFYNNNANSECIERFNVVLDSMKNESEKEKNIFYLSEDEIKNKIESIVSSIMNNTYSFVSIEKFINDLYEVFIWNKALGMNFDKTNLFASINNVLLKNYYDTQKEEYKNKIDSFYTMRPESEDIRKVIDEYNTFIENKYMDDKLLDLLETYNLKVYNCNRLEYFCQKLLQQSTNCKIKFHELCKNNNYLLPDLSKEIDEITWRWTHEIWDIYRQYMDEEMKLELNNFANSKISKSKNSIEKHRIEVLVKYKPLF